MGVALGDTVGSAVLGKHLDSVILEDFSKLDDSIIRLSPRSVLVLLLLVQVVVAVHSQVEHLGCSQGFSTLGSVCISQSKPQEK